MFRRWFFSFDVGVSRVLASGSHGCLDALAPSPAGVSTISPLASSFLLRQQESGFTIVFLENAKAVSLMLEGDGERGRSRDGIQPARHGFDELTTLASQTASAESR